MNTETKIKRILCKVFLLGTAIVSTILAITFWEALGKFVIGLAVISFAFVFIYGLISAAVYLQETKE